jgi:hypothetical protein
MRRFAQQVLEDIKHGENVDLIVTVALALIISVLNALGIASAGIISSITLATLGLIAIGMLVTRYRMEDIYKKADTENSIHFLAQKPSSLANDLGKAKEIWMLGLIMRGTTFDNFYSFKGKVGQGAKIRTLIANPSKVDMDNIAKRFSRAAAPEQFRTDFEQTINQYRQIRQADNKPDNVQLKLLDFVPPYSLYVFPKSDGSSILYVEMYGYRSPSGSIPKFQVTEHDNPEWYKHFVSQFEVMWQDSETVTL